MGDDKQFYHVWQKLSPMGLWGDCTQNISGEWKTVPVDVSRSSPNRSFMRAWGFEGKDVKLLGPCSRETKLPLTPG
jgi:hypothetical protein